MITNEAAEKIARRIANLRYPDEMEQELERIIREEYDNKIQIDGIRDRVRDIRELLSILIYRYPAIFKRVICFVCPICYRPAVYTYTNYTYTIYRIPSLSRCEGIEEYTEHDDNAFDYAVHDDGDVCEEVGSCVEAISYADEEELMQEFMRVVVELYGEEPEEALALFMEVKDEYLEFLKEDTGG